MWVYITMGASLLLSLLAFVTGIAPVGIALLLVLAVLVAVQSRRKDNPSARRAQREEDHDPRKPLGPAHEGQAHMTPDSMETP